MSLPQYRSAKLHELAVTLHSAVASLPEPTLATDGAGLDTWGWQSQRKNAREDTAAIMIDKTSGVGDITLATVFLVGFDATDQEWRSLGCLNTGLDITLTDNVGFEERATDIGTADRLALTGTVSTGTITVSAKPIRRV